MGKKWLAEFLSIATFFNFSWSLQFKGIKIKVFPLPVKKLYNLTVLIEKDEDGFYVATVPALKSGYTQAKTLEELYPRIQEVISLCLEEQKPELLQFVGVQQIQVAA